MKSKRYDMGGSLQQLLPLLDLAAPGLGTAASTVAGVLSQANAFNKQTTPLKSPTNPFRSYKNGGSLVTDKQAKIDPGKPKKKVTLGDIEFYEDDVRSTEKLYSIAKDLKTGKDYGIVKNSDGSWRYKNSDTDDLYISKMQKDYENYEGAGKAGQNTIVDNGESIKLSRGKDKGINVPTALLDSVIVASKRQKVDPSVLLGLISRESAFGKGNTSKTDTRSSTNKIDLISGHNLIPSTRPIDPQMFLANKGIPGIKVDKGSKGWKAYEDSPDKVEKNLNPKLVKEYADYVNTFKPSKSTNAFDWGIQKLKSEGFQKYNPGDPQYPSMLQKDINAMKSDPNIQSYIKKRTPELKFGGKLKSYNIPSHEQGGGLVDKMGNPASTGVAEIEKQESIYTSQKGKTPYVFSDTLVDSNGKTFSQNAKSVEKKFAGKDQISKTTHKKLMDELMAKNEIAKKMQDQINGTNEQEVPKFDPGGYLTNPELQTGSQLNKMYIPNLKTAMPFMAGLPQFTTPGNPITSIQGEKTTDPTLGLDMTGLTNLIDQRRTTAGYRNVLGNLQSGAFPMLPSMDTIPSGSDNILYKAKINPLVSQTAPKVPDITKPVTSTTPNPLGSLDLGKVGGILKGVALAGSAIDAFQKPEQEQLRVPDFSKGDKAYTGLGGSFDPIRNDIVQQAKSGENQIMQSAGNFGQVMSRLNALQAGVGRNLAQVGLQEKQYNDQIRMSKGQREDQKAGIIANEQIRKQTADSQNKAMGQDLVANLLQNVNNYGTEFMKQDTINKELKSLDKEKQRAFLTQLSLMNIQNPNFQINKDLINSDNPLSALTFKQ